MLVITVIYFYTYGLLYVSYVCLTYDTSIYAKSQLLAGLSHSHINNIPQVHYHAIIFSTALINNSVLFIIKFFVALFNS